MTLEEVENLLASFRSVSLSDSEKNDVRCTISMYMQSKGKIVVRKFQDDRLQMHMDDTTTPFWDACRNVSLSIVEKEEARSMLAAHINPALTLELEQALTPFWNECKAEALTPAEKDGGRALLASHQQSVVGQEVTEADKPFLAAFAGAGKVSLSVVEKHAVMGNLLQFMEGMPTVAVEEEPARREDTFVSMFSSLLCGRGMALA